MEASEGGMMKKKLIGWLTISVAVMLALPWLAVTFTKSDAGMAVTLLLFFAVDPIYVIVTGFSAGRNIKEMWSLPVMAAILFLLGAWIFFDMGEIAFILYAGVYLAIGIIAMLVSAFISQWKRR